MTFALSMFSSISQTYSGMVVNSENGEPVAFANIGIAGRNIGTVSDAGGWFEIQLDDMYDKDLLRISCIGYSEKEIVTGNFKKKAGVNGQNRIELSPISYQLDEVLIRPQKTKSYTLGYYCDPNSAYGNAFYSKELGTEIGVVINLPRKKKQAYVKRFRFYVGEFTFDKFPVRLNIYELQDGLPKNNILREPIFIEITSAGEYDLDLSGYNITATGDFFVSLEYFRVPDNNEGQLVFCSVHTRKNKGDSYYRWTSQGNWQKEMFDKVGFSVEVECTEKLDR